jgi:adenine-specific DNA-methyltransferase
MQLNAEDNGNRNFIMVQLPEETDKKSEAYKAGYKTIDEIGKERIRRAGKKIKEDNADKEGIDDLDIGFRVLKIDESNMKDIYFTPDQVNKASLFDTVDHVKEDRTAEDLLFGVLVDWGVDLTLPIQREEILGKTVFFVGEDALTACFDEGLDEAFITELAGRDTMRVVFKESGFKDDETKINAEQIFAQLSAGTDLRVI